jgi:hypothetical protein
MISLIFLHYSSAWSYFDWVTVFWESDSVEGNLLLQCLSIERIQMFEFYEDSVGDAWSYPSIMISKQHLNTSN